MLKKTLQIFWMAALAGALRAQTIPGATTLNGAISAYTTNVCVASGANVVTPSLASGQVGSILLVSAEAMTVLGPGNGTACYNVSRGSFANLAFGGAVGHTSGEKVWVLGPTLSSGDPSRPISTAAWLNQRSYQPFSVPSTPPTLVTGHTTTDVAGKTWISAMQVDITAIVTGACVMNGATVATDKWILSLWDDHGNLLANTATAGTTTAGASQLQCIAFTAPVALSGPRQYFVGVQGNGTTDSFLTYPTGGTTSTFPVTSYSGTFGTEPTFSTIPTTFTANTGPIMALYQ